ncbi:uncharacterized protein LOC114336668 [Diabrotica virgifera virgifera]|uniref:Peroxidase-like n=1 Tax=Diabrotica virgifera virgifera TaxID=50390 RepID=A0ABM5IUU2_DIAVI|nr:uncharacterized protein LOC114336668 [Diabrotica virgifera virgifera]
MEYIFKLKILPFLVVTPFLVIGNTQNTDSNITKYTEFLPNDIQKAVQTALLLEKAKSANSCKEKEKITCPAMKFREPSGRCNNVRHPTWGTRGQKLLRLLPPDYADGKLLPKKSSKNSDLPSPVNIAAMIQKETISKHDSVTALLGAWSELLLHDLASTGNVRSQYCCGNNSQVHQECYGNIGEKNCKEYMRTLPAIDDDNCTFAYRDQMNLATSFLDGSAIYGNTLEDISRLRTYKAGHVNISTCSSCLLNPLYTVFMKEHNRIGTELSKINPEWSDDTLFLESRRIVTAELQHITYNEFLPLVLGEETMVHSQLELKVHGRFSNYSSSKRIGVFNEVAIAALPALLSLVPQTLAKVTPGSFEQMIDALVSASSQTLSGHISVHVRPDWNTFLLFLHMGRDHGIASYAKYLTLCNNSVFKSLKTFNDLGKLSITASDVKILKELYDGVEDIDLIVGAVLEEPLPGAIVGPTINCLLKHQFQLLKESDRFWYENDLPPSSFTVKQLNEIKRTTLSGLICANTKNLKKLQPKAFLQEDLFLNSKINCDQYQLPALLEWKEEEQIPDLTDELLKEALSKAQQNLLERRKKEYEVWAQGGGVNPKSPQGTAVAFSQANKEALKLANTSLLFELASNEIVNGLMHRRKRRHLIIESEIPILRNEVTESLQNIDFSNLPQFGQNVHDDSECDEIGPCDPQYPFRTYTGHCNNLRNPGYGKALTTFIRLLPSQYEDGISKARVTGVTGFALPNPRIVSRVIHPDISNLHSRYTLMTMQYAQLVDHDLTLTPIHKGFEESIPDCRSCNSRFTVHPECDPLPIPAGDDYYPEFNITTGERMCLHSMRSLPGQQHFGPREQINMNSAFLDGSMIYGENPCKAGMLRTNGGLMNYTIHPIRGKDLLPQTHKHPECKSRSGLCFIAGDPRASEQPALTALHTVFMREHNRISDFIRKINPHWDEEKIFENVRKIVIALFQQITYNEFLPRILGWNAMNVYDLKLSPNGYFKSYNPTCNPTIVNEFAAAAFRIGHSLLRPHIPRVSPTYEVVNPPILLRDGFFKMDMMMRENMVDEITRGLISTPIETLDQFITGEVTNHLFEDRRIPFSGIDLIARNLQRARDHGIPSYNNYRAFCNLKRAYSFDDLSREMTPDSIARLKSIYAHVDDIDLFPGGMSEISLRGAMVGPTFGCIIGIQFRQLKKCDRFWFENEDPVVRFTEHQLAEIRKITLAKILCDNMDVEGYIQRYAFDLPSNFLNPRVPCHSLPSINLRTWKEYSNDQGCLIGTKYVRVGDTSFVSPCTSCICTVQGANCASLKVTDCHRLLRFWSREAVLKDEVCTAQCGFLLRESSPSSFRRFNLHTPNIAKDHLSFIIAQNFDQSKDFVNEFSHLLKK